jgi:hypothetical protein
MSLSLGIGLRLGGQQGGGVAAPVLTWTSGTAAYDPKFTINPIVLGNVVQLQVSTSAVFASTYGDDSNTVDSTEAASGSLTFPGIPTLAGSTTYYARARVNGGTWSNVASKTMDPVSLYPFTTSATGTSGVLLDVQPNWAVLGDATIADKIARNGSGRWTNSSSWGSNPATGFPVSDTASSTNSIAAPFYGDNAFGGLAFAVVDLNNYYNVGSDAGGTIYISNVIAGTVSAVVASVGASRVDGDVIKIVKKSSGTLYDVLKNGTVVLANQAINAACQSGTKVGVVGVLNGSANLGDITVGLT